MFKRYSLYFTLFAVVVSLMSLLQIELGHAILYLTSPTSWVIEIFYDRMSVPTKMSLIYITTIVFWYAVGRYIDYLIEKRSRQEVE
ncbi:hypothetical protein LOK74_04880 [Brevibacillus humidisoli]|uniref:hypothetical protein n=1 Tax=Brevibacillus humidisoli TaxID=2895522 RepID=UPI001E6501D0|nr:hypothetical protein [Brevibacillus humidisoli]UFJ41841.1 hypothetical protein LOK74_04880 [Brevibacillus humidisoli]